MRAAPYDRDALKHCAFAMADAAREAILPHFRTSLTAENKQADGFDPVTIADRAAEMAMREVLRDLRPDDGIIGEEAGTREGNSGLTWVLDPIDGTRAFISGAVSWGVLIGLQSQEGLIAGLIDQPYLGERFTGGFGPAQLIDRGEPRALSVRPTVEVSKATIMTTFPEVGTAQESAAFHRLAGQCQLTRYGLDCYAYALLAMGHVDLVVEAGLNAYDIAGPAAVVRGAGGVITNWQGGPVHHGGTAIAAATPKLHAAAMEILNA